MNIDHALSEAASRAHRHLPERTEFPPRFTLVSHVLCPYVQRAAIVLAEKGVAFERRFVDLGNKPAWFLDVSPLGKTPVLLVDGMPVFESAAICEYLDDTVAPRMLPEDPLERARHRGWIAIASSILDDIAGFYNAATEAAFDDRRSRLVAHFRRVEDQMVRTDSSPLFDRRFGLVDAAFAPVFRYFDAFETIGVVGILDGLVRVDAWRRALSGRASVHDAVSSDFTARLVEFLANRNAVIARH